MLEKGREERKDGCRKGGCWWHGREGAIAGRPNCIERCGSSLGGGMVASWSGLGCLCLVVSFHRGLSAKNWMSGVLRT